jgi:hypothetical protein
MPPCTYIFPTVTRMWLAYAIAPAVAPLSFVGLLFLLYAISHATGSHFNPASILVLPMIALTVGMLASYAVAGLIGMPIAFALRRWKALNFVSIHAAALGWACLFAGMSRFLVGGDGVPQGDGLLWFFYAFAGTAPSTLLSATAFWLIVRLHNPPLERTSATV